MADAFNEFLLPVAIGICKHKESTKKISTDAERLFMKNILTRYLTDYVKNPAQPSPDWKVENAMQCSCQDCNLLRNFVNHMSLTTWDFLMAEKRRRHLELQLDRSFSRQRLSNRAPPTRCELKKPEQKQQTPN